MQNNMLMDNLNSVNEIPGEDSINFAFSAKCTLLDGDDSLNGTIGGYKMNQLKMICALVKPTFHNIV
ncbi:hypothetical protein RIF29_00162 [Crotalaria pallida]|uniref:Uncharacterized protein n=1 Tax=Crotalaria pallida TaxID=3830 RepID=A0AAN9IW95_CROPI